MTDDTAIAEPSAIWPALLPWQTRGALEALAARASWPHALLLEGQRGIGKRTLALNFARALLCESPDSGGGACGDCASCGYIVAGQHPDFQLVEPVEFDDEGQAKALDAIPVDRIRALIAWSLLTAHRGRAKVAVIVPAESMNAAAANALLKTLEEPRPDTYLILVAHFAGRMPATLRSRCRRFPAPRVERSSALAWLGAQGVAEADAACVLAQAAGAPFVALALADPAWQQERALWLRAFARPRGLSPVTLAARVEVAGKDGRRERLALGLDWLLAWTADLGRVAAGGAPVRNPDFAPALAALAPAVAPIPLFRYHQSLLRQRALLAHPLQPRLVAEALLIDYRNLFR